MNKKIFAYGAQNLLCAFAVMLALAFTACDNGTTGGSPAGDPNTYTGYDSDGNQYELKILKTASNPVHTHTYSATWSSNATQHWRECTANDGEKTDLANHTFNGNICSVCNYNNGGGGDGHTHTYSSTWSSNATQHWRECIANDGVKTDLGSHTGNPCTVCGYSSGGPVHTHTWGEMQSDATQHWRECIANDGAITDEGSHTDDPCNVCGYSSSGPGNRDSRLINAPNDAWIDSYPPGERDGFIFKSDGTFQFIDDYDTPGVFAVYGTAGTWSTSGNNSLTLFAGMYSETYSYTVAGTTLTLTDDYGDSEVYTKMQEAVNGRSVGFTAPAGKAGTKAVTGAIKRAAGLTANRAATGDKFILTIKNASGTTVTSTGTVDTISSDGETLKLDHKGGKFTAKIKGKAIAELPDTIYLDDNGGTLPAPGTLTPTKSNPGGTGSGTEADPIPLTADVWKDGSVPSADSVVWYSFSVTGGTTYYIWWNDNGSGNGTKKGDVQASAYYGNGTSIFTNRDGGWSSPQSFKASTSGTVKIKVEPYNKSSSFTGTFAIAYSASSTRPGSSVVNVALPNSAIFAEVGLSGLSLPAGATVSLWTLRVSTYENSLTITGTGSSATDSAIKSCFISNGWTLDQNNSVTTDDVVMNQYTKDGFKGGQYSRSGTNIGLVTVKSVSGIVWPSAVIFTECGLPGLPQPADITDFELGFMKDSDTYFSLKIYSESVDSGVFKSYFLSNGWTLESDYQNAGEIMSYSKPGFAATFLLGIEGCQIIVINK